MNQITKRGAKPLPLYNKETADINRIIKCLNMPISRICEKLPFRISQGSLRLKLGEVVGWHEDELEAVKKIVKKEEAIMRKSLN